LNNSFVKKKNSISNKWKTGKNIYIYVKIHEKLDKILDIQNNIKFMYIPKLFGVPNNIVN